jgi:hypothetical protein
MASSRWFDLAVRTVFRFDGLLLDDSCVGLVETSGPPSLDMLPHRRCCLAQIREVADSCYRCMSA